MIEAFGTGVRFATFLVPASLGVQEGGFVVTFVALGLSAADGVAFGLVRRLRELRVGRGRPRALRGQPAADRRRVLAARLRAWVRPVGGCWPGPFRGVIWLRERTGVNR